MDGFIDLSVAVSFQSNLTFPKGVPEPRVIVAAHVLHPKPNL
jgi:hypothetical protein